MGRAMTFSLFTAMFDMNYLLVHRAIVKPYIGICKHLPVYSAGRGSDGFLLYHTASLQGSHLEGRSVRIRPRRFARRGLRVARDARRRREAPRRRPEPSADDGDAARAPGVAGRYQ